MRALTSSIDSGMRKDGPRRPGPPRPICPHTHFIFCFMSYFRAGAENCCEICLSACCTIVSHPLELERLLQHIVARLPEHRSLLPAIAYVSIHEYLSSPSVPIFIHTSPWLADFAWLVWFHRPNEDTRRSLKPLWVTRCLVCTANETKCIINASHQSSDVEVPCCSRNTLNLVTHMKIYPLQQHETKVIHSAEIAHVDCSSPH